MGATTFVLAAQGWQWLQGLCGPARACVTLERATSFQPDAPTIIEDAEGGELARLGVAYRRVVTLDDMPALLPAAFLAIEDARFYQHGGVDWQRVGGAVVANARARGVSQGFSTITMQLARNLWPEVLPARQRTVERKAREILVARQLEAALTKDQILYEYLNTIYLGAGAHGVAAAAEMYFQQPIDSLTLSEIALLAALPQAPAALDPRKVPDRARARARVVLRRMVELGWLDSTTAAFAAVQPWRLAPPRPALGLDIDVASAGHFVETVRRQAQGLLGDDLYRGGYRIQTTLDPRLQVIAESIVVAQVERLHAQRAAARMDTTDIPQAAFFVARHGDGAVLAHVGGVRTTARGFDRVTQAQRQAGSTFKPVVYAAALQGGFAANTILSDAPLEILLPTGETWSPSNFDGEDGERVVTLAEALRRSLNRPTVRLGQLTGAEAITDMARRMGWRGDPLRGYPAEWLGSAETTPADLASVYAAIAREDGLPVEWRWMASITDRWGRVVWAPPPVTRSSVGVPDTVHGELHDLLESAVRSGTGFPSRSEGGYLGRLAGKTGTTNESHDVWFAGYTPSLVLVSWFGMDRPSRLLPGSRATGGRIAAPVVGAVLHAFQGGDSLPWPQWARRPLPPPRVLVATDTAGVDTTTATAPSTAWCLRDRTPADTGAVVTLLVPCPSARARP